MPDGRHLLGARGEDLAARWYEAEGYDLLARNWRCRYGEADLICRRRRVLVVCEVKTRSSSRFGVPAEAVTPTRQGRLRRTAAAFLQAQRAGEDVSGRGAFGGMTVRFDVAEVTGEVVTVIEGAF